MDDEDSQIPLDGEHLWERADYFLASFAQKNALSRGREYPEPVDPDRLPYQRDRDRIIHTTSFRRLKGKMQVLSPSTGDHFRNRLTHTLEVAQIARDLARQLRLNEDLAEAIALAHDLGHPPFGHMGESILDQKMKDQGLSFDHNEQSLRVVQFFERRYREFPGLNLSRETLDGVQKHERDFGTSIHGARMYSPHLESQLVDISDEIAYLSADVEDALRGDFVHMQELQEVDIVKQAIQDIPPQWQGHRPAIIRRVIRNFLMRIIEDTKYNLQKHSIQTLEDAQQCPHRIVAFSPEYGAQFQALKSFLFDRFYSAPSVRDQKEKGEQILCDIFDVLLQQPEKIPAHFLPEVEPARRVCDYIAGMTDSYAVEVWESLRT